MPNRTKSCRHVSRTGSSRQTTVSRFDALINHVRL